MLLYHAPNPAPNPRRVRIYLAERGIAVPMQAVSIPQREHKADEYLIVNPLGQVPTLVTDEGVSITESVSICRYFEAQGAPSAMFGETALDIALVDQSIRRAEMVLMTPIGAIWAHTHPYTARVVIRSIRIMARATARARSRRWRSSMARSKAASGWRATPIRWPISCC